ncbi:hypothetical protein ACFL9U_02520 [Thermodesulfobacteriota bacterium]
MIDDLSPVSETALIELKARVVETEKDNPLKLGIGFWIESCRNLCPGILHRVLVNMTRMRKD